MLTMRSVISRRLMYLAPETIKQLEQEKKAAHVYRKLFPWKSEDEFADHLLNSAVYNKDGLLVVNKPYGIVQKMQRNDGKNPSSLTAAVGEVTYSLESAIPHMERKLGTKGLQLVKGVEKYTSGLSILSSSRQVSEKVKRAIVHAKTSHNPPYTFRTVVVGYPKPAFKSERTGLTLVTIDEKTKAKQAVIQKEFSKQQMLRGEVKPVVVEYRSLLACNGASLLEISCTSLRWHFLRVYLAHHMSPVLGDHLYGSRVKSILGINVALSPYNAASHLPQVLPERMLDALQLSKKDSIIVPAHIHLYQLTLPGFFGKNQPLVIKGNPPQHFLWTCDALGLDDDFSD